LQYGRLSRRSRISWKHSGFSVDQSVRLEAGDSAGVQRLIEYFLRCPCSQARMIEVTDAGKVIYKTEHKAVGRFPEPGEGELLAGPSRNFQVFDPLDFLAACPAVASERRRKVTQHLPNLGEHLVRYYGWYSNQTRGQCAQRQPPAAAGPVAPPRSPSAREARKGWAALIKKVYESDPLCCPKCGSAMKIIAFIYFTGSEGLFLWQHLGTARVTSL
jgi:Putative transposase